MTTVETPTTSASNLGDAAPSLAGECFVCVFRMEHLCVDSHVHNVVYNFWLLAFCSRGAT